MLGSNSLNTSTSSLRRLHAKTPVFAIGQLEADGLSRPTNALASEINRSSAEILAEQYRALLASRNSMLAESRSEPPSSPKRDTQPLEVKRHSADAIVTGGRLRRESRELPSGSPTSDDGTLVSFEEDTIYFKPVSFSPEPRSPLSRFRSQFASPSPAPDNLRLQICMDLLTRDLASTMTGRRGQGGPPMAPETAALQVWVMIEAYERLREELLDMRLRYEDSRPLEQMFDMWLRSLYSIHDTLKDDGVHSESDYDGLESEDLD